MPKKHKFQTIFEEALPIAKSGDIKGLMDLMKKRKLKDLARDSLVLMLDEGKYIPELESFFTRKDKHLFKLEGDISKYDLFRFLEDAPPKNAGDIVSALKGDETYRAYENMGIVRKATVGEYNRHILHLYVAITRLKDQHDLDMREALAHNDAQFFEDYFIDNKDKKKIAESLKRDGFKPSQIQKVFKLISTQ